MPVTMLYAGLLGLVLLALTVRVVVAVRVKGSVVYGDAGNADYTRVVRAQGNFIEYVPMALVLIGLLEAAELPTAWLHGLGGALLLGRIIHPFGLSATVGPTPGRLIGSLLTWLVILAASLLNLWIALR